jgi:hypothetical protein
MEMNKSPEKKLNERHNSSLLISIQFWKEVFLIKSYNIAYLIRSEIRVDSNWQ